jgi:hypothetical protein
VSQNFHKKFRPPYTIVEICNFKLSFDVNLFANVPVDGSSYKLPGLSSSINQSMRISCPKNEVMPLGSMFVPFVGGISEKF